MSGISRFLSTYLLIKACRTLTSESVSVGKEISSIFTTSLFLCLIGTLVKTCSTYLQGFFTVSSEILVGILTDGDRSMTGRIQDVANIFEKGVLPGLMQVWCGFHQLDFLLQDFFKKLLDE